MKTKNKAFTLAETLVVMGIIGVIAALTIPNLSQSTSNREKVTKVKKAYSELSEATDRAIAIYGPMDTWFSGITDDKEATIRYAQRITEFMKVAKVIGYSNDESTSWYPTYSILSADGSKISFKLEYATILPKMEDRPYIGVTLFPNKKTPGNSFGFYFSSNGLRTACYQFGMDYFIDQMKKGNSQYCASKWVIDYDNMDYLKMDENWKCPNGKVLNLTANPPVTSCN